MELNTWLIIVRILNLISSGLLISFQIWFIVELFIDRAFIGVMLRIWAPIFLIFIAILIITLQFKYEKMVENFKFLQWLPGLAIYNIFIATLLALQFSTIYRITPIVLSSIYLGIGLIFLCVNCCKPSGERGLLAEDVGITVV